MQRMYDCQRAIIYGRVWWLYKGKPKLELFGFIPIKREKLTYCFFIHRCVFYSTRNNCFVGNQNCLFFSTTYVPLLVNVTEVGFIVDFVENYILKDLFIYNIIID